jgi:hypothetical protein
MLSFKKFFPDKPINVSRADIKSSLLKSMGEKEADEVMSYINLEIEKEVAQKVDIGKKEIITWREDMGKMFATRDAYEKMQAKLIRRVSSAESTLILWSFVFWITQIVTVYCILKFLN